VAEYGFGGGNAVQADRAFGKLQVHGRVSLENSKVHLLDRLINLDYVNQYEESCSALPFGA
jgi:hypothetical protein